MAGWAVPAQQGVLGAKNEVPVVGQGLFLTLISSELYNSSVSSQSYFSCSLWVVAGSSNIFSLDGAAPTSGSEGTWLSPTPCHPPGSSIPAAGQGISLLKKLRISGHRLPSGWSKAATPAQQVRARLGSCLARLVLGRAPPAACTLLKILLNSFTLQGFAKKTKRETGTRGGCQ